MSGFGFLGELLRAYDPAPFRITRRYSRLWVLHCRNCETSLQCSSWDIAVLMISQSHDQHRSAARDGGKVIAVQHWFTGAPVLTCAGWRLANQYAGVPELQGGLS